MEQCKQVSKSKSQEMGSKSGHPALQARKTNPHKRDKGKSKNTPSKPNQIPMISTKEGQREQLQQTRNQSRSRTRPNNGLIKVQHIRNLIQQEQGSESTKNPQLDLAKSTARSNKTNSRVGQQRQAKLNKTNSRIQQEEQNQIQQKGGCQPNVD